jgi:hypothetical protein
MVHPSRKLIDGLTIKLKAMIKFILGMVFGLLATLALEATGIWFLFIKGK